MPNDYQSNEAQKQALMLSRLESCQSVAIQTSSGTHPRALSPTSIAMHSAGMDPNGLGWQPRCSWPMLLLCGKEQTTGMDVRTFEDKEMARNGKGLNGGAK